MLILIRICNSIQNINFILFVSAGMCNELSHPDNGTVILTGLIRGSFAIYTCNIGFMITGERLRICMANGMWSGQEPKCTVSGTYIYIYTSNTSLRFEYSYSPIQSVQT